MVPGANMSRRKGDTGKPPVTKEQCLKAIEGSGGIYKNVAARLGRCRGTTKQYVLKWRETREAFEQARHEVADLAEYVIVSAIEAGDLDTAKWWMRMSPEGRDRGFMERHAHTGDKSAPIEFTLALGDSDEEEGDAGSDDE